MATMQDVSIVNVQYSHDQQGGSGDRLRGTVTYSTALSTHVPEWDTDGDGDAEVTANSLDVDASSTPANGQIRLIVWEPNTIVDMSDAGLLSINASEAYNITEVDVSHSPTGLINLTFLSDLIRLEFDGHDESAADIQSNVDLLVTNNNSGGIISFSKSKSHDHFFDGMTPTQLQALADLTGRFIAGTDLYTPASNGATGLGWTINGGYTEGQRLFNGTGFTADGKYAIDSLHTGTARDLQPGRARTFDGVDDYIQLPVIGDLQAQTISLWYQVGTIGIGTLFGRRALNNVGVALQLSSVDGHPLVVAGDGTSNYSVNAPVVAANTWAHVAYTWDGSTLRIYLNGIEQDATAFAGPISYTGSADWFIGGQGNLQFMRTGQIFDVRIFDRALTDAEVRDTMTPTAVTNGLVAWYKLSDGTPQLAWDSSGNGFHGSLTYTSGPTVDYSPRLTSSNDVPYSFDNSIGYTHEYRDPISQDLSDTSAGNWFSATGFGNQLLLTAGIADPDGGTGAFRLAKGVSGTHLSSRAKGPQPYRITMKARANAGSGHVGIGSNTQTTPLDSSWQDIEIFEDAAFFYVVDYRVGSGNVTEVDVYDIKVYWTVGTPPTADLSTDVLGNPIEFTGDCPRNAKLINSHCLTLDGLDDQVQSADTGSSIPVKKLSIRFKGDLTYTSATAFDPLITFYDGSIDSLGILFGSSTSLPGIVDEVINFKTSNTAHSALEEITLSNDWHLLEADWDGSKYTMKIDGAEMVVNHQGTAVQWDARQVTLGARGGFGSLFPGRLADVQIYDNSDVLQYHYKCSEGSGTVLYDYSGNGRHITMVSTSDGVNWPNLQNEYHANIIDGFSDVAGVKVGRLTNGTLDAQGNTVTNPTGNWHNGAETQLDLTGGVASPFAYTMSNTTFAYGDTPASVSCHFETNANGQVVDLYSETNHLIYRG